MSRDLATTTSPLPAEWFSPDVKSVVQTVAITTNYVMTWVAVQSSGFVLGQLEGGAREGLRRGLAAARDLRGVARAHGAYVSAALRCCFLGQLCC